MMTRHDYVRVSEGLRTIRNTIQDSKKAPKPMDVLIALAEMLADMMEEDNDRFDRKIFMTSSGLSSELSAKAAHYLFPTSERKG
jgi:hypothetical protein